jgi:TonB family protein
MLDLLLVVLLAPQSTLAAQRDAFAQTLAADLFHMPIHKLYVPDPCDSTSHPIPTSAYFAAAFSELLTDHANHFTVLDRIDAHRFLLQNRWTDCDLERPEILQQFAAKFGIDSLLAATLTPDPDSYALQFMLTSLSGKPLHRATYQEARTPRVDGSFPAAAAPSGWPLYFVGHDGVRNPRVEKIIPAALHKPGVSGVIIISVYFTTEGKMEQFRYLKKLDPGLDAAALATLQSWQFSPAKSADGTAVPVRLSFEFPVAPE